MPTIKLSKGSDRVTVDEGSEAERIWRERGYTDGSAPVAHKPAPAEKAATRAPDPAPAPVQAVTHDEPARVATATPDIEPEARSAARATAALASPAADVTDAASVTTIANDGVMNVAAADVMAPPPAARDSRQLRRK
jgi:hypothetical protein